MARITSKKLTDQTADRLFQMIISDPELCPGSKLPNETELCALFGVSRTTVRGAVRFLAAQGYVEILACPSWKRSRFASRICSRFV